MPKLPTGVLLNGIVKAVPSGDTVIVMKAGPSPTGPPPELKLTLSFLRAPLLRPPSDAGAGDEPHAFASREFLRRRLIGKLVGFVVREEGEKGRVYGELFETKGAENIAVEVVRRGWARLRKSPAQGDAMWEKLRAAEEEAIKEKAGLHGGDEGETGRRLGKEQRATELLDRIGQEPLPGIVEYVSNGSAVRVYFRRSEGAQKDSLVIVCMSGVQCPGFRRQEGTYADGSSPPPVPLPYALNARHMTEVKLLHRDVLVRLEGTDRSGMLFGTIELPDTPGYSIAAELLRKGFAKTVGWSIELTSCAPMYRAAERSARDARLALWKDYVPSSSASLESSFSGSVVEVVSGDMVAVLPDGEDDTAEPKRISLASVRAPRPARGAPGSRTDAFAGVGYLAKEALRKKLVGRRVNVKVEYVRQPGEAAIRKTPMTFATVEREGDSKNPDVALALISTGLLTVIRHRGDEERAANYEEYLGREKVAAAEKVGIHKSDAQSTSPLRINDLTGPDSKRRSQSLLHEMLKSNPHRGVIEYVSTASRYRVYLPRKSMLVTLALKAVRVPQPSRRTYLPDGTVKEEKPGEPYGDISLAFARRNFMQRDVEVTVSSVDRVGAFLGNIRLLNPRGLSIDDVSLAIIETGHGILHESFDPSREAGGSQLRAAEQKAKEHKKGVWVSYVPEEEVVKAKEREGGAAQIIKGTVCEVGMGGQVYIHDKEAASVIRAIEQGMASLQVKDKVPLPQASLKIGQLVCAKFTDDKWYRARIIMKEEDAIRVNFIDYGNEAWVGPSDIVGLPSAVWSGHSPAATRVTLAHIRVPDDGEQYCMDAGRFLYEEVYGKPVTATVVNKSKTDGLEATIDVDSGEAKGLREKILEAGLARVVRKSGKEGKAIMDELGVFEEVAKRKRAFLWQYGDAYASDEDDDELTKERNRKRYG